MLIFNFQHVLKVSERSFQRAVLSGYGLIGGPCFYSYCITFLWSKIENKKKEIEKFKFIRNLFFQFLEKLTDKEHEYGICLRSGHYFKNESMKCECGIIARQQKYDLYNLNNSDLREINFSHLFENQNSYEICLKNLRLIDCFESKINAFKIARDVLSTFFHVGIIVTN